MAILERGGLQIDFSDEGAGEAVVLLHSSASSNRQWRALTAALTPRHRVLGINRFGYGGTTPWRGPGRQSLAAQAELVMALCDAIEGPVHLVGHSTGGSVALKAAELLGRRVASLVLLEPNPFYLLRQNARGEAYIEILLLRDGMKRHCAHGDWQRAGKLFADYWQGLGTWDAMTAKRRAAFIAALPPVLHEWDAVMDEETPVERWSLLPTRTMLVSDRATRRPIAELADIFARSCRRWIFMAADGGHMAPLTRPELVNPLVEGFIAAA